jgi:hypothetical protein
MSIKYFGLNRFLAAFAAVIFAVGVAAAQMDHSGHGEHTTKSAANKVGILILAHGGDKNWNAEVEKAADSLRKTHPVEVAFGMASKRTIQPAVDALVKSGVEEIVAVPLFISSHSSVITSTEFLLGARAEAPKALAAFAKMNHGHSGDAHAGHAMNDDASFDPLTPVESKVPIRMTPALNAHPLVAEILLSRALEISKKAENEVVILVAHGPVSDEENQLWLNDMAKLADGIRAKSKFARIDYLTVRDDAPKDIRDQATAELRTVVQKAIDEKRSVLIVPLLLSYGGIEKGIQKRLDGLDYTMSNHAILPDERLVEWIRGSVETTADKK